MSEEEREIKIHCIECDEYLLTRKRKNSSGKFICRNCFDEFIVIEEKEGK